MAEPSSTIISGVILAVLTFCGGLWKVVSQDRRIAKLEQKLETLEKDSGEAKIMRAETAKDLKYLKDSVDDLRSDMKQHLVSNESERKAILEVVQSIKLQLSKIENTKTVQ